MTIPTVRLATAAFLAMLTVAGNPLKAQEVILSEIRADNAESWVEVHNRNSYPINIGTWSLYYATHTAGQPQRYWWGFPLGTILGPNEFVRVHWFQSSPGGAGPGEFYTGNSPYGFLFYLGGEALHGEGGALALFASQSSNLMNDPAVMRDWVSWGDHDFQRESIAVQAGYWSEGTQCPAIPGGQSLARNAATIGSTTTRNLEWFLDPTPTPGSANLNGAEVLSYGQACGVPGHHLLGAPQLHVTSLPLIGNSQFGYAIDNTTGVIGECMLFAFSAAQAPSGLPSLLPQAPGPACREAIDTRYVITTVVASTHLMTTNVPLSLANLSPAMAGVELHTQAMVFDWLPNAWPPYQGVSNALKVVIGQ